jgi:hypothetical protein
MARVLCVIFCILAALFEWLTGNFAAALAATTWRSVERVAANLPPGGQWILPVAGNYGEVIGSAVALLSLLLAVAAGRRKLEFQVPALAAACILIAFMSCLCLVGFLAWTPYRCC